ALFFAVSCSCNDAPEGSPYLEKDYNYITGILVPDSFRTYRQEIFVGRMLDEKVGSGEVDINMYGEDTTLWLQNLVTWHDYRGKLVGTEGATVKIKDQDNHEVVFQDIGKGFYRDVENALKIKALNHYELTVVTKGRTFTAETSVPGDFYVTNLIEGDTIIETAQREEYFYWAEHKPSWTISSGTFYYRTDHHASAFEFNVINHVYSPPGFFLVNADTLNHKLPLLYSGWFQVMAMDSNYGRMYSPEESSTAPIPLLTYLSTQETKPLPSRTNIKGRDATGVFGSINRTKRISFYFKMVK
ncbi:MAG TPA: hypothetical protein PLL93_01930, partial [bacterium]|nr:hypothetical protein [bacterium]